MEQLELFGIPILLELHRPVTGHPVSETVYEPIRFTVATEDELVDTIVEWLNRYATVVAGSMRYGTIGACLNERTRRRIPISTEAVLAKLALAAQLPEAAD